MSSVIKQALPVSSFEEFVGAIYPLPPKALKFIRESSRQLHFRKGDLIVRKGEIVQHLFLIKLGAVRAFINESKKDITTWICTEGDIITSIKSFLLQQAAAEDVEAVEDCTLWQFAYKDLQYLYSNYMEMNIVGRKVLERYYCEADDRAFICRLNRAKTKYHHFEERKGHLLNRIPLKHIASYLGMTLETLSRIRKEISRKSA